MWAINGVCSRCARRLYGESADGDARTPLSDEDGAATVRGWFDAFNERDLDGMLIRMHPRIDFHPLRLQGIESAYLGHDGVRRWFDRVQAMEHGHRVEVAGVRAGSDGQLIALGSIVLPGQDVGEDSFWALERLAEGLIIGAYHYLTDPNIAAEGGLLNF